eukprot:GHVN01073878.1.p1 GENE.GHVN01073878.1~~GHVN01073878.1.p1  ORF type:complete len:148 (-),score=25.54 GHVN01073878.1:59-502(-)
MNFPSPLIGLSLSRYSHQRITTEFEQPNDTLPLIPSDLCLPSFSSTGPSSTHTFFTQWHRSRLSTVNVRISLTAEKIDQLNEVLCDEVEIIIHEGDLVELCASFNSSSSICAIDWRHPRCGNQGVATLGETLRANKTIKSITLLTAI